MKTIVSIKYNLLLICILLLVTSCIAQNINPVSPPGYDLNKPEIIELPKKINQISGITYNATDNFLFAIDDDHGNLYKISLDKDPEIENWEFGKDKDYEEVILWNNTFYILNSNGQIIYFRFSFPIESIEIAELDIKGKNEFEILFKDPVANRLLIICKECKDEKKTEVSVYAFDLTTNKFEINAVQKLKVKEIEKKLGKEISRFKSSAANVHPLTGEIYILSSINKLLVVTDPSLKVKEVYELDPEIFKQPEGLCFTPSGDLFISNESAGKGKANILMYKRQ